MRFPVERFYQAFERAGLLVPGLYKPGTPQEVAFNAHWLRPDALLLADDAHGTDYQIEYQRADLPPLLKGDRLDLAGVAYTVRARPLVQGDGHFARVLLDPV